MKKTLLILGIIAMMGAAFAVPFTALETTADYPSTLTAGNIYQTQYGFNNTVDEELPLVFRITASSESGVEGPELVFDAKVNSTTVEDFRTSEMTCRQIPDRRSVGEQIDGKAFYSCYSEGKEILPESENTVELETTTHVAMSPDNYQFESTVYSRIGKVSGKQEAVINNSTEFDLGSSNVRVDAEKDTQIMLWKIDESLINGPQDVFLGGVDIQASELSDCALFNNDSSQPDNIDESNYNRFDSLECDLRKSNATGHIEISYDDAGINENTVSIYYFNPETGEWEKIEEQTIDTSLNIVEADVDHFSVYAVYSDERANRNNGNNAGRRTSKNGFIDFQIINDTDTGDSNETTDDDQIPDDNQTEPETPIEEEPGDNNQTEQPEDTPTGPTGQFLTNPSNLIWLLLLAIIAATYYYRERLKEAVKGVKTPF